MGFRSPPVLGLGLLDMREVINVREIVVDRTAFKDLENMLLKIKLDKIKSDCQFIQNLNFKKWTTKVVPVRGHRET